MKLRVLQFAIMPVVAAQRDTPWTAAVETISKSTAACGWGIVGNGLQAVAVFYSGSHIQEEPGKLRRDFPALRALILTFTD